MPGIGNLLTFVSRHFGMFLVCMMIVCGQLKAATLPGATAGQIGTSPSGSASFSIPITVPVGTTGLQPNITLQYDSLAGSSIAGMGWTIGGLSVIGRCATSYQIDGNTGGSPGLDGVDYDANDKFCLNGQRLVAVSGAYGAANTEYRTYQDEFTKVVSYGTVGSGPLYFKAWRKSGELLEFGNTADSRIEALGRSDVWVWALNKLSDSNGNYETFSYSEDSVDGGYRINRIDYTGNTAQNLGPYNWIEFAYAGRQDVSKSYLAGSKITQDQLLSNVKVFATVGTTSELFRDYQITYDSAITHSGRSRPLSVKECAPNVTAVIDCFPATTFQWSADGMATLTTVPLSGTQGISPAINCTPGGDFNYTVAASGDFNGDSLTDIYLVCSDNDRQARGSSTYTDRIWLANGSGGFSSTSALFAQSLPNNFVVGGVGDFNGDGLTDLYCYYADTDGQKNGASADFVLKSNGNGTFSRVNLTAANSAVNGHKVLATGDYNGDGINDLFLARSTGGTSLINVDGSLPYILMGSPSGSLSKVTLNTASGINIGLYHSFSIPATGDFNGDGLTDMYVMRSDKLLRKSGSGNADHYWIAKWTPATVGGTLTFQDVTVPVANSFQNAYGVAGSGDYNGDGLVDLYVIRMDDAGRGSGNLQDATWMSKGNMTFEVVSGLSAGSQIGDEYKISAVGDFTGDGLTDHYVMETRDSHPAGAKGTTSDYILESNGNGSFTKVSLAGAPGIASASDIDFEVKASGDFDGDGLLDLYLMQTDSFGRTNENPDDRIFLSAWTFADQLTGITNGAGVSTELIYKPLTDSTVYTRGTGSIYPVQEVTVPRYVVSEVRTHNGLGGFNSQTYRYEALRNHVYDIGNLGFAKLLVTDGASGIVTESVYSQDWAGFKEGLLTSNKTTAPAPYNAVLSEQTVTWSIANGTTSDGTPRRFRYSPSSTSIKRDLNGSLLGTTTENIDYSDGAGNFFSNYGFPRQTVSSTVSPDGLKTYAKSNANTYTHDTVNWVLGRLASATVTHQETGKPTSQRASSFTYFPVIGLLQTETVQPGSPLSYTKTYAYDGFGATSSVTETWGSQNSGFVVGALGNAVTNRVTSFLYDPKRRYKIQETNPLGHTETSSYDPVSAVLTTLTGPSGLSTTWTLQDAFGRHARETRADGTYTTTLREFCGGVVACPALAVWKVTTSVRNGANAQIAPTGISYQDKLGREIRVSTQSFNGVYVHVDTVYDARGRIQQKSEPYFQGSATIHWTNITYDLLNRPTQTTRPDGTIQSVAYNGLTVVSTNELNQTKTVVKDAIGRDAKITDHLGKAIVYNYDALGQLLYMEVEAQPTTPHGQPSSMTSAATRSVTPIRTRAHGPINTMRWVSSLRKQMPRTR